MQYISYYQSPLGKILLAADQTGITGAWFENQKYYARGLDAEHTEKETPVLDDTKRWLDLYFSGKDLTSCRRSIRPALRSRGRYGTSSGRFLTGRP